MHGKRPVDRHGRRADLDIQVEGCVVLRCDSTGLTVVVEELVENACAYSRPGTPVRVELRSDRSLRVVDFGIGMEAATLDHISCCLPFVRHADAADGLGVGLFIVGKILRRFGAAITFSSGRDTGTSVTVRFLETPRAGDVTAKE